jgi:tetratricopeptide (TPR) repeat protein
MWDKILTDADGPYAELMVGAFSDNQPDYSWIKPYETKTFKQYWYPVREIGGFKNANLNAAVNLELKADNIARVGFNTTSPYNNAIVLLTASEKVIFEQKVDIGPGKPFVKEMPVPAGTKATDLKASLLSASKDVLISYQPIKRKYDPKLPGVVKAPPAPSEIKNIEQLYLTGLRLEQIHNPRLDPCAYYEEALKRDPGDCRTNTILGINYSTRGMFTKAEEHLRRAVERVSAEYTRPGNAEAYYYLGLALKAQGKFDEAYDALYRATWDYAFHSAAYYQLAELSCRKGEFAAALEQIDQSLSTNTLNTKALDIKAAILRHLGKLEQAKQIASSVIAADPLDFLAMNELYLAESAGRAQRLRQELMTKMRGEVQSYLELALDYGRCGLWDEAIDVLDRVTVKKTTFAGKYPMVYYYLAYFYQQKGNNAKASEYLASACKMPSDYCFPFRLESIKVLEFAIRRNPSDARAHYYLGNLLYELQPENAIEHWEKSRQLDDSFAPVHRNLGWAYYRAQKNTAKAIGSYENAVACDKEDASLYAELDHLYEMANTRLQKRLALLEENHQTVVKRNDSFLREIMVLVLVGRYDQAIGFLANNNFHVREGGGEIHDVYVDAHLLRGLLHRRESRLKEALDDFRAAAEYPENLSVGRPKNDRRTPQVAYYTGTAYEASGDSERATEFYKKAADQKGTSQWSETRFYQGLSLRKLGQEDAANKIFDELIEAGRNKLAQKVEVDFFAKFGEQQTPESQEACAHYILGLGYLGKGQRSAARSEFERTVALDVSHVWAKAFLAELD